MMGLFERLRYELANRRKRKYDAAKELDRRGYRMVRLIKRGRFGGAIYLIESKATGDRCAVKVTEETTGSVALSSDCAANWLRMSDHRHCVRLRDRFTAKGRAHLVCDFAVHGDLMTCLERAGQPFGPHLEAFARRVTRQVLQALDHCHRLGMAHLDFRWTNVLLDDSYDVRLTGFRFMCSKEDAQAICVGGDPLYHPPPETLTEGVSRHLLDKVDVWQLGAALVHMLLGWYVPIVLVEAGSCSTPPDVALVVDVRLERVHLPTRLGLVGLADDVHDFLRSLLQYRPQDRPSAARALEHRWLLGPVASPSQLDEQNNWKTNT